MQLAKKKFGQNFLIDLNVIKRIQHEIKIDNNKMYLEIGPGKGALTEFLTDQLKTLMVVEIDKDMINALVEKKIENLKIKESDVLKLDNYFFSEFNIVIGNLPYYIATEIIFKFLPFQNIDLMYFMLQKEVADRLVAKTNTKNNSVITNLINFFFESEKLIDVEPESFDPKPKVKSTFIKMTRHDKFLKKVNYINYKTVVKEAFRFKRKNLKNNLMNIISDKKLKLINIDPQLRAENLSVKDFINISNNCEFSDKDFAN